MTEVNNHIALKARQKVCIPLDFLDTKRVFDFSKALPDNTKQGFEYNCVSVTGSGWPDVEGHETEKQKEWDLTQKIK